MATKSKKGQKAAPFIVSLSDADLQRHLDAWDQLDSYVCQEVALTKLFQTYPNNTELEDVLLKCTVLNEFYSAGVLGIDLLKIAEHIVRLNIDSRLHDGKWDVVPDICSFKGREYYSFASKYCNWHNPQAYPIYDSYVDTVLWNLNLQNDKQYFKTRCSLKEYETYGNVLKTIAKEYNLKTALDPANSDIVDFKILDKYLWLYGKANFSETVTPTVTELKKALYGQVHRVCIGDYVIVRVSNDCIKVTHNGVVEKNTIECLRKISKLTGFQYDTNYNTRQFGKKLIEFIKSNKK